MSKPKPAVAPRPAAKPAHLSNKFARALFAYEAAGPDELSFSEGDLLYVLDDASDPDWWRARCRGKEGLVPANFLPRKGAGKEQGGGGLEAEYSPMHDACR